MRSHFLFTPDTGVIKDMKHIEVRIRGAIATGKTTALEAIIRPLEEAGFRVVDLSRLADEAALRCVDGEGFDPGAFDEKIDDIIDRQMESLGLQGNSPQYVAFIFTTLY